MTAASAGEGFDGHVPDGEFWARFFPSPAPGDDTIYFDSCPVAPELGLEQCQEPDQRWFWVVWWRGRPAVSGWALTDTDAGAAAAATTAEAVTRQPGSAALYLAAVVAA